MTCRQLLEHPGLKFLVILRNMTMIDLRIPVRNLQRISQYFRHDAPLILKGLACSGHDVPTMEWSMIDLRAPLLSSLILSEVASSSMSRHAVLDLHDGLPISLKILILSEVVSFYRPVLMHLHNGLSTSLRSRFLSEVASRPYPVLVMTASRYLLR